MTKIDRSWIIKCKNGAQMNAVWRVLKEAGEPMFRDTPNYIDEETCIIRFLSNKGGWGNTAPVCKTNITFEEFMTVMKPENKKDQYITNLLDYLDKPELIQHIEENDVRAIHHFPKRISNRLLVVFENGKSIRYNENGGYGGDKRSGFVLKPKAKEYVTSWRRPVICEDGSIMLGLVARPTKEAFMRRLDDPEKYRYRFGPWEEVVTEVCDE